MDQPRTPEWQRALDTIVQHQQSWHKPFEINNQPLDLRILNLEAAQAGE
jgi:hypothetical protein